MIEKLGLALNQNSVVPPIIALVVEGPALVEVLKTRTREVASTDPGLCMGPSATSGMPGRAVLVRTVSAGTSVRRVLMRGSLGRSTRLLLTIILVLLKSRGSINQGSSLQPFGWREKWQVGDF